MSPDIVSKYYYDIIPSIKILPDKFSDGIQRLSGIVLHFSWDELDLCYLQFWVARVCLGEIT